MADWYVSSAVYATIPVWQASHAYSIGDLVKPTAPTFANSHVFRVTTAGTSGTTEPTWTTALSNNNTITGGATFTNVSGQSTYGWSAAAGTLYALVGSSNAGTNRNLAGDRVFISSDHSETVTSNPTYQTNNATAAYGACQFISINRAGSVPPTAADAQSGASITNTGAVALILEGYCNSYWEGISFIQSGTTNGHIYFNGSGRKSHYLKNCVLWLNNTTAANRITTNQVAKVTLDNTTVQFGNVGQGFSSAAPFELHWINTPSAIQGATIPTTLFNTTTQYGLLVTCRGVDLSAITGNLVAGTASSGGMVKAMFDSCKIASGVTRLGGASTTSSAADEVELVNCWDGSIVLNEHHTYAGSMVTDHGTYMNSGAQDDVGNYSLRTVTTSRSDFQTYTLDDFWLDIENIAVGSSKTATVEVASSLTLTNADIRLLLEYMAGGSAPTTLNPSDKEAHITLSGGNLTAVGTAGWTGFARAFEAKSTGKFYWETTFNAAQVQSGVGLAIGSLTTSMTFSGTVAAGHCGLIQNGIVYVDGSSSITVGGTGGSSISFGTIASGTVICIAVDIGAKLIWWRLGAAGNWNNNAARDPATGIGGVSIPNVGTTYPTSCFGGADTLISNFGASSFVGTPPSGFTAGWPSSFGSMASFGENLSSVLATASALPNSSKTWTGPVSTTWNPGDVSGATLNNVNLTVTNTVNSSGVRGVTGFSSGKYYFEVTFTSAAFGAVGLALGSIALPAGSVVAAGTVTTNASGAIQVNGSATGNSIASINGSRVDIAVDLTNNLIWFRNGNTGFWNASSGSNNPATGVGGISISAMAGVLFPYFGTTSSTGQNVTANFGATSFVGIVPSGFTAGWPGVPTSKQLLQVSFMPQRAGRVRGLVRLGRNTSTVWVNPQLTVT